MYLIFSKIQIFSATNLKKYWKKYKTLQEEINAVVAEHNEAMIVAESEKQQELSVKESEKVNLMSLCRQCASTHGTALSSVLRIE